MKSEIKIMKKRQAITDEEIETYKNFDALLTEFKKRPHSPDNRWGIVFAVMTVMVAGTSLYLWYSDSAKEPEKVVNESAVISDSTENGTVTLQDSREIKAIPEEGKKNEERKSTVKSKKVPLDRVEEINTSTEQIYVQAKPIEGYDDLYAYFTRELIYPPDGLRDSIKGILTVVFIIDKEGKPGNISVEGKLGKSFESEALRLIENMPPWSPATLNNVPVSSKISLPLTFQIWHQKPKDH